MSRGDGTLLMVFHSRSCPWGVDEEMDKGGNEGSYIPRSWNPFPGQKKWTVAP